MTETPRPFDQRNYAFELGAIHGKLEMLEAVNSHWNERKGRAPIKGDKVEARLGTKPAAGR